MKNQQGRNKNLASDSPMVKSKVGKPEEASFFKYFTAKQQLAELMCITIGMMVIHLLLFYWYPTPCTFADTKNYLLAAQTRSFMGYRPYGYSWFLVFVSGFSPTTYAVYFFQFLLNYLSCVFFIFTVKYIVKPSNRMLSYGFSFFVLFSPATLYMTNYLMSDSLFISLTVFWITLAIWVLYRRSIAATIFLFLVLAAIVQVRYTGLLFLVLSVAVCVYSYRKRTLVAIALSLVPVLIGWLLYSSTKSKMRKIVGLNVFSGFQGWQLANNALHIIPYIDLKPEEISDPDLRMIHELALALPDSVYIQNGISAAYIWENHYPLKEYLLKQIVANKRFYVRAWVHAGGVFTEYGSMLIKKYPGTFVEHFVLPNLKRVVYPDDAEAMGVYAILPSDNNWFVQESSDYREPVNDVFNLKYAPVLPFITFIQWMSVFAALAACIVFRKRIVFTGSHRTILVMLMLFACIYTAFGVFAAPFALRFLLPLHALQTAIVFIVIVGLKGKTNTLRQPA